MVRPTILSRVARGVYLGQHLRFRYLKKCHFDKRERKTKPRTFHRKGLIRGFNLMKKLVPSEVESQLRRIKYACARHQDLVKARSFRIIEKILRDNAIRNNFTKWRLEMQKQLAYNRIEAEYQGKSKRGSTTYQEKRRAAASLLASILLQRQLQNRFRHESSSNLQQNYHPFKSYESVSDNRIRYSSAVISPQKKIEGTLFWGSPAPRSSNRSTECTNSAIAHFSNFSTEERHSPTQQRTHSFLKIANHFLQRWKVQSFSIDTRQSVSHGGLVIANILGRFLRQKVVSAFVSIQLNGYHRVVNKKVTSSKVSLKALVKHLKLKTTEGGYPLTPTEMAMLKLLQKSLFRPLYSQQGVFQLLQKWRYACAPKSEQDSGLSSSHTLMRSGFGQKWENPLTVRHFQHLSRCVSSIILSQIFSTKRLSFESYRNAMVKSNALRAWKRRVYQEQKFQNDGENILTETHYRLIQNLVTIAQGSRSHTRMLGFNKWRAKTFKLESEQEFRKIQREEISREFENEILEVQAKVNSKLEGELGVLNSVYLEIAHQQLNIQVVSRIERALGGALKRVQADTLKTIAEQNVEEFKSRKEFQQVMLCLEQQTEILESELQNSEDIHFDLQQQINMLCYEYNCEECVLMRKRINLNQEDYFIDPFQRQITDNSEEENDLIISSHSNTGRKNLLMIDVDSSSNQADHHPKTSGASHNRPTRSSKGRFTPYDPFCNLPTMSSSTSSYQKHAQMQFSPSTKNTSLTKGIRSEKRSEMEVLSEQKQNCEDEEKIVAIEEESNSEGVGNSNEVTQRNELGDEYVKWLRSKSNFYSDMLHISDDEFFQREETDDSLRALQFQVAQLENESKPREGGLF